MNTELLDLLSDILQIYNTILLTQDASNNEVMKELQNQDREYLDKIVNMLNDINIRLKAIEEKVK